ncbi:MAG: type II secretion system F family protein [Gammaproteobacteria bacterium]|nr:type II secretion system F family protein [Gammaproteobacteria bacterium]
MPEFQYSGRNRQGEVVNGVIEAGNIDAVANQLLNTSVTPIDIKERLVGENGLVEFWNRLNSRKPDLTDLIMFSRQMYSLMRAGVPLIRSLSGIIQVTNNRILREAFKEIQANLSSGRELSVALARHPLIFSPLYVSMIRIGENTGRLDESFLRIAQYLELEKDTRERVKSALRYPSMVIVAMAIAIAIVNIYVIPAFADVFQRAGAELPLATKILINTSGFFVSYWPFMLAVIVITLLSFFYYIKTDKGRVVWGKYKIRLPLVGKILNKAALGRFARAFSMSLSAGVPIVQALTVVSRAVDNDYIGEHIADMRTGIERGDNLTHTATLSNMFSPLVLQMLAVGEETGQVDEMLEEVAGFYEREVEYDVKNLSAAIEPIMIVLLGGMVLILALGIFLPMWDLASVSLGK